MSSDNDSLSALASRTRLIQDGLRSPRSIPPIIRRMKSRFLCQVFLRPSAYLSQGPQPFPESMTTRIFH